MFGDANYEEGDRVEIIDPLTRTVYGVSGVVVAVMRSRGRPTTLEVEVDGSADQSVILRTDEVAPA